MGNDVLRVCPERLGQRHLQRARERLDLLELAVLKNDPAFQAGLILDTGRFSDRWRKGKRPERPVADANGVDRFQPVMRITGHHVGDARRHPEARHVGFACLDERIMKRELRPGPVQVHAMHTRPCDALG